MWEEAIDQPDTLGFTRLTIDSDRFAERVYRAMGAQRIGATPSPVDAARLFRRSSTRPDEWVETGAKAAAMRR